MVNVSWWAQTTELPCAYKNIEAVAAQGSKSRRTSVAGEGIISDSVANLDFPFEERPELIDIERFLDKFPADLADMAAMMTSFSLSA
jgi:hypothetical protein